MRKILLLGVFVLMFGFVFAKDDISARVPDFKLSSLKGESVSLNYYTKNKDVSFLVFFTTWCPWCSRQMETFELMAQDTSANVVFLAIGLENEPKKVANKINSLGITYPVVLGNSAIAEYFNVSSIPVTVVIDKAGKKIDQVVGYRDKKYFSKYLLE